MKKFNVDGWINAITGLGLQSKDKRTNAVASYVRMTETDAEELYASDDTAGKIVDTLPNEGLRAGFKLTGVEPEISDQVLKEYEKLEGNKHVLKAWKYARLYGGSGLFMVTSESADLSKPLVQATPVMGLSVFSRWELYPEYTYIQRDLRKPGFGLPTVYSFQPRQSSENLSEKIHATRLVRFDGAELPERQFINNQYWHDSVLNKLQNAIMNYTTSHDSAAAIVADFRIGIFKIKNLADAIAQGNDQDVIKRLQLVDLARSITRAVIVDAEGEDFEYKSGSVAGLKELLEMLAKRLVAGTDMPHTILLGESPSGSNATGNSTVLAWYDHVASQQKTYLKPRLRQLLSHIAMGQGIVLPEGWDVDFNPLWQMDEKEVVELRNKQAQTDQVYFEIGVLDSAEIRESRFGGDKYSIETEAKGLPPPAPQSVETTPGTPQPKTDEDGDGMLMTLEEFKQAMNDGGEGSGGAREGAGRKKGSGKDKPDEKKFEVKLMGSAGSEDAMKGLLDKFFYNSTPRVQLKPDGEKQWSVWNGEKHIEGTRVIQKGGRFRFEMLMPKLDSLDGGGQQ